MNAYGKILKNHPLFSALSSRTLNRLTNHASTVEMAKGSFIAREKEKCEALYVVLSGRCQSTMIMPDGSEQIVDVYVPGDSFGERALLTHDRYWKNVKVITDSVFLRLEGGDVLHAAKRNAKFEKALEARMHGKLRSFKKEFAPEKLGRAVVFSSSSTQINGENIAHNTAIAVRKETNCSVLYVSLKLGHQSPALADWDKVGQVQDIRKFSEVHKEDSGVWELRINVRGEEKEAEYVAPLLSHLVKNARYIIMHLAHDIPASVAMQFIIQCDMPYLLMGQKPDHIYKCNLLVRNVREHPLGDMTQLRPLICLDYGERAQPFEALAKQLGVPVGGFIHGLPKSAADTHDHYLHSEEGRFSAHIRHLAREIGRCRIGLALSAGGAKAFAHVGVIQALEENGIEVDVVAGTSMGGLIGSIWSYGISGKEMEKKARELASPWKKFLLFDPAIPPRKGFIRGRYIKRALHSIIGDAHFSDMQRQLRVVATDLNTLERVTFDSGEVAPIIHASMAMPGVVVPVTLDGRTYVDGGVADPIPVDVLIEMGIERIIAVNTIPNPEEMKHCMIIARENKKTRRKKRTFWGTVNHYINYFAGGNILDIWMKSMHGAETRVAEGACRQADVVLRPVLCDGKWHDFGNAGMYVELGRRVAEEKIDELRQLASK